MTIPEAGQLVLQAATFSVGGEVFLLDMGQPRKIYDLALNMIKLNGLTLKNKDNPDGDIEISFTGLRPGEKLYEELLVEPNSQTTKHPLIFKAIESNKLPDDFYKKIDLMNNYLQEQKITEVLYILSELVSDWKPGKYLRDNFFK